MYNKLAQYEVRERLYEGKYDIDKAQEFNWRSHFCNLPKRAAVAVSNMSQKRAPGP